MKNLHKLDAYRRTTPDVVAIYGGIGNDCYGVFDLPSPRTGVVLKIVASRGEGWDHVSVSLRNRCPNWEEMELVKRAFFEDDEVAMQLHVAPKDHVSVCHSCLHLWRPHDKEIPLPPKEMVF